MRLIYKAIFVNIIFILLFFINSALVRGNGDFKIDAEIIFDVNESGITDVTNNITLENKVSEIYAPTYVLNLENINPEDVVSYQDSTKIDVTTNKKNGGASIIVTFPDALVGIGKTRSFSIKYSDDSLSDRTGEVWEISIPKLSKISSFDEYNVSLVVPNSLGFEAYVSPQPISKVIENKKTIYRFEKDDVSSSGIVAGFGQFQVFSFTLNYHLDNPSNKTKNIEIAIPPDTSLQKLTYHNINPKPENVRVDVDGNWLAEYILTKDERYDVVVSGTVQIFANPVTDLNISTDILNENTKSKEFWQIDDQKIKEVAEKLTTPRSIYDFVINYLDYDYQKINTNVERKGALFALNNPSSATCMEFTDLFIALSRANNIPAREVNGFAYTENKNIQPLSLVSDVLHAWPEYWDKERKTWIAVDPTWGNTTNGVDYFDKLDLRHFTFVIHGRDPLEPFAPGSYKLGDNPQKDVFVSFGQLPANRITKPQIIAKKGGFLLINNNIKITISNPGPLALYDLNVKYYFDKKLNDSYSIDALPPYSKYETTIEIPFTLKNIYSPNEVKIKIDELEVLINSERKIDLIKSITFILLILIVISIIITKYVFKIRKKEK